MTFTKDDVAKCKNVNGVDVPLTDRERQAIADEWNLAEAERARALAAQELERKRAAAVRSLEQVRLEAALTDPAAPQPVKDYAVALEAQKLA